MTLTTIKVPSDLRDELKVQAVREGRTLAQHLRTLVEHEERRIRFEQLRDAVAEHPADARYRAELAAWESDSWL